MREENILENFCGLQLICAACCRDDARRLLCTLRRAPGHPWQAPFSLVEKRNIATAILGILAQFCSYTARTLGCACCLLWGSLLLTLNIPRLHPLTKILACCSQKPPVCELCCVCWDLCCSSHQVPVCLHKAIQSMVTAEALLSCCITLLKYCNCLYLTSGEVMEWNSLCFLFTNNPAAQLGILCCWWDLPVCCFLKLPVLSGLPKILLFMEKELNRTLDDDSNMLPTSFLPFSHDKFTFSLCGYIGMLMNPTDVKVFEE